MCGIGCILSKDYDEKLLEKIIEANKKRGTYSFGFYNGKTILKTQFIEDGIQKLFNLRSEIILFQFRTPTVEIKEFIEEENPPFTFGNWVWVANVVSNQEWWLKESMKWSIRNDAYVLGRKIILQIEQNKSIDFEGTYSIILYNTEKKKLYVAVSGFNLYYFFDENGVYLSSVKIDENWQVLQQNKIYIFNYSKSEIVAEIENNIPWLL